MTVVEHRTQIVAAARWGVSHNPAIHYTESVNLRGSWLKAPRYHLPMSTDCSGFATWCYWVVGAPDPGGNNYRFIGDTETIAAHGHEIKQSEAHPGDFVILGLEMPLYDQHMVVINAITPEIMVISHGSEAGPLLEPLSHDTRSKRFFQYKTTTGE